MKTSFVYILLCADDTYYTGISANLEMRLIFHKIARKNSTYVSKRLPFKLVYYQQFMSISQAISWEKHIKNWSKKKKEALINENWEQLQEYSRCKNDSSHENF